MAGLSGALDSAISSLQANQQAMSVISNNISNANTEGYTRRILPTSATVLDGKAAGVTTEAVQRIVDASISQSIQTQSSELGYTNTVREYYEDVSLFLGDPGQDNSLGAYMDQMFSAFSSLANDTDSASVKNQALTAIETVVGNLSALAGNIESTRYAIDQEVNGKINDVNKILDDLDNLNQSIKEASFSSSVPNALLDKRDMLLNELATIMDVSISITESGEANIAVDTGQLLASGQRFHLSYVPAPSEAALINNGNFSGIYIQKVDENGNPQDNQPATLVSSSLDNPPLERNFETGELMGLLDMRDNFLPQITEQLDELAVNLADAFNAIHNQGAGFPPPSELTGTNAVTINQNFLFSGDVRVALVDSQGLPVTGSFGNGGLPPLTIDFDDYTGVNGDSIISVAEFIDEFNNYYGAPPSSIVNQGPFQDIDIASRTGLISSTEATGNIQFVGNPGVNDTIVIDGNTFTFTANGVASTATTIELGTTLSATIDEIVTVLNNSATGTVPDATYSRGTGGDTLIITHDTAGTAPNGTFALDADVTNGGGTANINGVGAAADPAASALGLGTGTAGANATGAFAFDLELFNYTGSDATVEVLDVAIDGVLSGATMAPQTIAAGDRSRTAGSVSLTLPGTVGEGGTHTLAVQVRTTDSEGVVTDSTIEYEVTIPDPTQNILNNRYGFTAVTAGDATTQAQLDNNPFAVAQFVDADGNEIPYSETTTQGYLRISTDQGNYGIVIDEMDSQELGENGVQATGTGRGFSHFFGMNDYFVLNDPNNAALGFDIRAEYKNDPNRISTGSLSLSNQPVDPDANPLYTYEIGLGSNQIITELAALRDSAFTFNQAGDIPQLDVTFNEYATEILSFFVTNTNNAIDSQEQAQLIYDTFKERFESISGVNIDEELANTVLFQNNYNASARLVSIISDLFDELVNSV